MQVELSLPELRLLCDSLRHLVWDEDEGGDSRMVSILEVLDGYLVPATMEKDDEWRV